VPCSAVLVERAPSDCQRRLRSDPGHCLSYDLPAVARGPPSNANLTGLRIDRDRKAPGYEVSPPGGTFESPCTLTVRVPPRAATFILRLTRCRLTQRLRRPTASPETTDFRRHHQMVSATLPLQIGWRALHPVRSPYSPVLRRLSGVGLADLKSVSTVVAIACCGVVRS